MLTRELLNYRVARGAVKFEFYREDDPVASGVAGAMTEAWKRAHAGGWSRGELEEHLEPVLKGSRKPLVAAGMLKLMFDGSDWCLPDAGIDYPAARSRLFVAAGAARRESGGDYARFRQLLEADPECRRLLESGVYPDLPENERMTGFSIGDPGELIRRYNLGMVQALLLYSRKLELEVSGAAPADLRRLCRAVKFFRLLAAIGRKGDGVTLTIEGPLAIFGEVRKYGLQLASFFPAAVRLKQWRIVAAVKPRDRELNLTLDQESGLVSHYRHDGAYVPEEIALFAEHFKKKAPEWRIVEAAPFISAPPELIFPDFCFSRKGDKRKIALELFHRWHATALAGRLAWLDQHPEADLILGIDRALLPDGEITQLETRHPQLAGRLFAFRDFPGVDRVRKILTSM